VVAPRQQPQALRGLIDQIGFRQDAAADRHHGIGSEDEGAAQLVVELDGLQRGIGLGAGEAIGAGARQLARFGVSSTSAGRSASGSMPA